MQRSICDMTPLIFHLVLSSFTFDGVDTSMAQKILDWNLKRYPEGACLTPQSIFFFTLLLQGCFSCLALVDSICAGVNPTEHSNFTRRL